MLLSLVLFADAGHTVYLHSCNKTNVTTASIFNTDDCCDETNETKSCCHAVNEINAQIRKEDCCSVSFKYFKQSFPCSESVNELPVPVLKFYNVSFLYPTVTENFSGSVLPYFYLANAPPKVLSQSFIQVFRC